MIFDSGKVSDGICGLGPRVAFHPQRKILPHPVRALCQHLKRMLRTQRHDREHLVDHLIRDERAEQVRHRAHENPTRLPPAQRSQQHFLIEENLDVLSMPGLERQACAEALVERFGVTELTSGRGVFAMPPYFAGLEIACSDRSP